MNLIILGPPGAGKGTQSNNIAKDFNLKQVSTGDLLRDEIKLQTILGKKIELIIANGEFVPDEIVNSLIDDISIEDKCKVAKNHFDELTTDINQFLGYYIGTIQELKVALTLDYAFRTNNQEILGKANWSNLPESFIIKDIITRHSKESPDSLNTWPINDYLLDSNQLTMYSTLEKAMILKSVDLFASIPSQELIRVAQIAEEEEYQTDTSLCKEGDYGDCMYIIANGKVKVHKGDHTLVELEKGAFVGDMALLDQEPRSADLTTSLETTLLKISQDAFYELMSSNFEIMNGILKIISSRLREAQAKL